MSETRRGSGKSSALKPAGFRIPANINRKSLD
jgi:hypothetical protein